MCDALTAAAPPPSIVPVIRTFLAERRAWSGSATDLLDALPPVLTCHTPQGLSRQLKSAEPALLDARITLRYRRLPKGARILDLSCDDPLPAGSSQPLQPVPAERLPPTLDPPPGSSQPPAPPLSTISPPEPVPAPESTSASLSSSASLRLCGEKALFLRDLSAHSALRGEADTPEPSHSPTAPLRFPTPLDLAEITPLPSNSPTCPVEYPNGPPS